MSAQLYTITALSEAVLEVKGSKFLCALLPFADYNDALAQAKRDHAKASHIIPVFRRVLDDQETIEEGCSDDGEPSGTAGRPTLAVLQGNNLVNVGLYIVRYFGGTKLGTGPLARAYSGSARLALEEAVLVPWEPTRSLTVAIGYDLVQKMELELRVLGETAVPREHTAQGVEYLFVGTKSHVDAIEVHLLNERLLLVD